MFIIELIGPWVFQVLVDRTPADMLAVDPMGTLRRLVVLKVSILLIVVFFGYQGPMVVQFATQGRIKANRARETVQEGILGLGTGLLNRGEEARVAQLLASPPLSVNVNDISLPGCCAANPGTCPGGIMRDVMVSCVGRNSTFTGLTAPASSPEIVS